MPAEIEIVTCSPATETTGSSLPMVVWVEARPTAVEAEADYASRAVFDYYNH